MALSPSLAPADDDDRLQVVNCYDEARKLVRRVPLWRCDGAVVSDDEAEDIRERRLRRTQRQLQPGKPLYGRLRMQSSGTGFFVSSEGHLLTNDHVVERCSEISVKPTEERDHEPASLVARNERDDLALILYSGGVPSVAAFRRPLRLKGGSPVAVIGHPLHGMVAIEPVFVTGSVRSVDDPKLVGWGRFSIDADVRRGNSGGPVIDEGGYVVGVVVGKINTPALYERTGTILRDVGLAIRQDRALAFLGEQKVRYRTGNDDGRLDGDALETRAVSVIARIGCWR